MDNQPGDDGQLRELALFAGAGGGILGGHLLGWRTVCAVEWSAYPASVLVARQNEGILPPFPIWDDVQTFDGRPWHGRVDVVSGGFPCQDISAAGRGAGIEGERSSMWKQMARIIGEVRPRYAFIENSPMLVTRGLDVVLCDLAALGYDVEWGCLSAEAAGANHERDRIWVLARNTNMRGESGPSVNDEARIMQESCARDVSDPNMPQQQGRRLPCGVHQENADTRLGSWWQDSSDVHRVDDGVAARMDRLKAIGNGQVPICMAEAFRQLTKSPA